MCVDKLNETSLNQKNINASLEESNKELEAFCYAISHDLRAPLRRAKNFCNAAVECFQEESKENGISYISKACNTLDNMNELIDDLLRLSKIQQQAMQNRTFDMTKMAIEICQQLNEMYASPINFTVAPNLKLTGDSALTRILLENLLGNAWKYSQKTEKPKIEFGVMPQNKQNVYFIKDNGVGFDMHYAYKLFTPFQRLHSHNEFEGTGIGLATAKRIVHRHNGRIWAKSSPGKGATFYFIIDEI